MPAAMNPTPFNLLEVLQNSVYYPASAVDAKPMHLLGQNHDSFVYADYLVTRSQLIRDIRKGWFKGYAVIGRRKLKPSEFVPGGFSVAYPLPEEPGNSPDKYRPIEDPEHPLFAEFFIFQRLPDVDESYGPSHVRLLFLCIDGCAGYQMLYNANGIAPAALCVIRPGTGFGLNWDDFRSMSGWFAQSVFRMGNPHLPTLMVTDQNAMAEIFTEQIAASPDGQVEVMRRPGTHLPGSN